MVVARPCVLNQGFLSRATWLRSAFSWRTRTRSTSLVTAELMRSSLSCTGHTRVRWPCPRSGCQAARASVARHAHPDNVGREKKWEIGSTLQKQLKEAVFKEDFEAAARLRDEIKMLNMSPMQQLEMQQVAQLREGTYDEKLASLKTLGQLYPTEETQALIVDCLHDERLTVFAHLYTPGPSEIACQASRKRAEYDHDCIQ